MSSIFSGELKCVECRQFYRVEYIAHYGSRPIVCCPFCGTATGAAPPLSPDRALLKFIAGKLDKFHPDKIDWARVDFGRVLLVCREVAKDIREHFGEDGSAQLEYTRPAPPKHPCGKGEDL